MGETLTEIRKLDSTESSDALNLALRVFPEFGGHTAAWGAGAGRGAAGRRTPIYADGVSVQGLRRIKGFFRRSMASFITAAP